MTLVISLMRPLFRAGKLILRSLNIVIRSTRHAQNSARAKTQALIERYQQVRQPRHPDGLYLPHSR